MFLLADEPQIHKQIPESIAKFWAKGKNGVSKCFIIIYHLKVLIKIVNLSHPSLPNLSPVLFPCGHFVFISFGFQGVKTCLFSSLDKIFEI